MDKWAIIIYAVIYVMLLFGRVPIAIWFLNKENRTDKGLFDYSRAEQLVLVFYWYQTSKREHKAVVRILNAMLVLWGIIFLGAIVFAEINKS